ncbi:MAG: hypothetical protein ACXVJW_04835 [Acidimicrobiia bacterium]
MAEREDRWPFGASDGGPADRPLNVEMEGVLVAILESDGAGEHAIASLTHIGIPEGRLRFYRSAEILIYEEEFRSDRTLAGRLVGGFVDDADSMAQYVEFGREGRSAVWVLVPLREDANRVVRCLADEKTLFIWYHGHDQVETIPMA